MSLLQLPEIKADFRLGATQFDLRPDAVDRWSPEIQAAKDGDATISIMDTIGDNWEGTGVTSKLIGSILRNSGGGDIVVDINSPGGDFFEGVAIYNQLREHKGKVTVRVLSLAASAASVIAMAGDEILMGEGAFLMIHNAWAVAVGNRHDLADASERLAPFDAAMASLYAKRAGIKESDAATLMDKETWISADKAVADGFATGLISGENITTNAKTSGARKPLALIEASMAKAGYSRAVRRDALKALFSTGKPSAAETAKPSAGEDATALMRSLLQGITS